MMSILNQKTINNKIAFNGIGLHTGKSVHQILYLHHLIQA